MLIDMIINQKSQKRPESLYVVTHRGVVINFNRSRVFLFGENDMSNFRRKCECNCSGYAKTGKRFIQGHNGRKRSPETIEKQERTRKKNNKPVSKETRKKISKITKQQWQDPEGRKRKMEGIKRANLTEETLKRKSKEQKNK